MKTFYLLFNILILSCLLYSKFSYSEEDGESSKAIGEGKAIEKVSEEEGFRLSEGAIKALGIKFQDFQSDQVEIHKDALVASGDFKGVFRFRDNYFKLIEISLLEDKEDTYLIKLSKFQLGDKLIISGVNLLRVADIYSTDKSEYKD